MRGSSARAPQGKGACLAARGCPAPDLGQGILKAPPCLKRASLVVVAFGGSGAPVLKE